MPFFSLSDTLKSTLGPSVPSILLGFSPFFATFPFPFPQPSVLNQRSRLFPRFKTLLPLSSGFSISHPDFVLLPIRWALRRGLRVCNSCRRLFLFQSVFFFFFRFGKAPPAKLFSSSLNNGRFYLRAPNFSFSTSFISTTPLLNLLSIDSDSNIDNETYPHLFGLLITHHPPGSLTWSYFPASFIFLFPSFSAGIVFYSLFSSSELFFVPPLKRISFLPARLTVDPPVLLPTFFHRKALLFFMGQQ